MGVRKVLFPCDLPHWNIVSQQLLQLQLYCHGSGATPQGLAQLHHQVYLQNKCKSVSVSSFSGGGASPPCGRGCPGDQNKENTDGQQCVYQGLVLFLEQVASADEKECFLHFIFPAIVDMACAIDKLLPHEGIPLCKKQCTNNVVLSRNLISSIISCAFLCLFPERKKDKTSRLNNINFTNFFQFLPLPSQCAKLRCILQYFNKVASVGQQLDGHIQFQRQVMGPGKRPTLDNWHNCITDLCPIYVRENGKTYDASNKTLKVGFSNRFLGGHVLGKGRCQEEILFMTCPELIASMLFMEAMDDNEAITVSGYEKLSEFSGYADSLRFAGDYCDKAEHDTHGRLETMLSAVNMLPYKFSNQHRQYLDRFLLRDLNKNLVGFQAALPDPKVPSPDDYCCSTDPSSSSTQTLVPVAAAISGQQLTTADAEDNSTTVTSTTSTATILANNINTANATLASSVDQSASVNATLTSSVDQSATANVTAGSTTTESTDVEGERKEVKFVEDIDSFAKRLTREIISEALCDLNPQCICGSSEETLPRYDNKSVGKLTGEPCSLHGSGMSSIGLGHPTPMDYLDVDYHDWISNFRRRSSNLSDLTSRRSSCSTRYSSDISSDLEELYESFMKRELATRPGTIHEENGVYSVQDFAANFIDDLLQESAAIAYSSSAIQNFQNIELPAYVQKPMPIKFGPEPNIDRNANVSFISEDAVQHYVDRLFEDVTPTLVDSESLCLECDKELNVKNKDCTFLENLSTLKNFSDSSIMLVEHDSGVGKPMIPDTLYSYSDYLSNEIVCEALNEISGLHSSIFDTASIISGDVDSEVSIPSTMEQDLVAVADKLVRQIFQEAQAIIHLSACSSGSSSRRQSLWSDTSSVSEWMSGSPTFMRWVNDLLEDIVTCGLKMTHKTNTFMRCIESHGVKTAYTSDGVHGVYLPEYDKYALDITKELFTNAFLEVHENYLINPYYRQLLRYRNVEGMPSLCSTDAGNCCGVADQKFVPQEDLANFYQELERQSSLSEQNRTLQRSTSGFRDITLSQFAEELMQTDLNSQSLTRERTSWHKESGRSGSLSGFKDDLLASFEDELLRSHVGSPDMLEPCSSGENLYRQGSIMSRTDTSDDPTSKDLSEIHSISFDSEDNLSTFADHVADEIMQESFLDVFGSAATDVQFKSSTCWQCLETLADEIAKNVIHIAILTLQNSSDSFYEDLTLNLSEFNRPCLHRKFPVISLMEEPPAQNIPAPKTLGDFADEISKEVINSAVYAVASCRGIYQTDCRAIASTCGIPGSNPQLEVLLQWMVASFVKAPVFIFYTKQSEKLVRLSDVVSILQSKRWTVGDLMGTIHDFCSQALEQLDTEGVITLDLFEEVIIAAHRTRKTLAAVTSTASASGVTESTSFEMDISKSLDAGALTPLTLGHTATSDADLNDCPLSVDLSPVLSISPPLSPPLFPNRTATTCDNHPD